MPLGSGGIACAELAGIDEYRVGGAPDPTLPALPDSTRVHACEECVTEKCADERETCLNSPPCRDMLRCQGRCNDPNCLFRCKDEHPPSVDFDVYFACAFNSFSGLFIPVPSRCRSECGVGENWECVDGYSWDLREGKVEMRVQVRDPGLGGRGPLTILPGVDVSPCHNFVSSSPAGDAECSAEWKSVDGYGFVDVSLSKDQSVFTIRGGAEQQHRIYPRPISRSGDLELRVPSMPPGGGYFSGSLVSFPDFDPTLGFVFFEVFDCLNQPATARVELEPAGNAKRFYVAGGPPSLTAPAGFVGMFFNVEPAVDVNVTASIDTAGGPKLVSKKNVVVAPAWQTTVVLYPKE